MLKPRTLASAALAAALAAGLGGAASAHGAIHRAAHHKMVRKRTSSPFLKVLAAKKTVVFTILAGDGTNNGGLDFDNTSGGTLVLTVPVNWTVDVVFKNVGGLPHSVLFDTWSTPLSDFSPKPAFPGAQSPQPIEGTPPGGHANFHFKATKVGKYRMVCAFPGHAVSGMWDTFIVSETAKAPSLKG